jgi:alpha-amylase
MKRIIFCSLWLSLLPWFVVTAAPSAQAGVPAGEHWWNDRVFYQIFVRAFQDTNADDDGDLQGLIDRLDYLNDGDPNTTTDLGITGLWLMPIMQARSYHGYNVTDYMQVEVDYGTNEDFQELITAAHERGIAVIIDLVLNHTSREHPWFQQSLDGVEPYSDWYMWSDTILQEQGPWGQDVWHGAGDRFYYGIFDSGLPDLNLQNPDVTAALNEVTRYWLEDMGVDGFRLDAARHYIEAGPILSDTAETFDWLETWNTVVTDIKPDAFTVGEIWTESETVARYIPDQVDTAFEFDLALATLESARTGLASPFIVAQQNTLDLFPPNQYATFLANHDQERAFSILESNVDASKTAASLLLTGPGVPFLYYGEEIGMVGTEPDQCVRTPMQWEPSDQRIVQMGGQGCRSNARTNSVAVQTDDSNSLLSHYRTLVHLRNTHSALRVGDVTLLESASPNVYASLRHTEDQTIMVLINLGSEPVTDYALSLAVSDWQGTLAGSVILGQGEVQPLTWGTDGALADYQPLASLPPYSTMLITLSPQ